MKVFIIALCVCICSSLQGADRRLLEGTVVDAVTGEPVKNAQIRLRPLVTRNIVSYGFISDPSGHFVIHSVEPGQYELFATRNGYITQKHAPLRVDEGRPADAILVKMIPQGVIAGRILDVNGEPVAHASVQLMTLTYVNGRRRLVTGTWEPTNDLGEFRFFGLRRGKYAVRASYQQDDVFTTAFSEERYVVTYFPNTTDPKTASQIEVKPGSRIGPIDITLARVPAMRLKGRVGVATSNPLGSKPRITLTPRDPGMLASTPAFTRVVNLQGDFEMRGIVRGSYLLWADYSDSGGRRYVARVPLDVTDSNIENLELELQRAAELPGVVRIDGSSNLAGAALNILLTPQSDMSPAGGAGAPVNRDLSFNIANISPDAYDVNVQGLPDGFYIKSIRMDDLDVTETGVDFTQSVPAGKLTVVIDSSGGQLDGVVRNSKTAAVTLIPDRAYRPSWLYKMVGTDPNGRFNITGVRPGEYTIYAWETLESGAYLDRDFVKRHESAGKRVTIRSNDHQTLELQAVPSVE
jgi:hypothetical protein